jgi:hypothetical protein
LLHDVIVAAGIAGPAGEPVERLPAAREAAVGKVAGPSAAGCAPTAGIPPGNRNANRLATFADHVERRRRHIRVGDRNRAGALAVPSTRSERSRRMPETPATGEYQPARC